MIYKSITTVLHRHDLTDSALEVAIDAARRWNAHLHVLCIGLNYTEPGFYYAGAQAISVQKNLEEAHEHVMMLETAVKDRLHREEIAWDAQAVTLMPGALSSFLFDNVRFHDLVILPLPHAEGADRVDVSIFEACIFGAERPVLVVPAEVTDLAFSKIMIAWDDSTEAMAASRAALPLLQQARVSEVTLIDPPAHATDRSDPGGRLAQYLAASGAKADIHVVARSEDDIAHHLLRRARERGVDLIVMGAYGHSRLREAIIGGTTRHILEAADVPVFMAH